MSLSQRHGQLVREWKKLRRNWNIACGEWSDAVRREFERKYWERIEASMSPYANSLEELAKAVQKAKKSIR